ncbi:MAG: FKBP-type peptidyl-prolyl cis-trans isomerase [Prevotellaceae bacterium]|nr:FKBP-type peptidyl-prolyl cis-trans isomerase [Prevotellaceae bacterium]MDY2749623.1 FKBP-type peptidyl-prolyl cis-trans isomerase [Prevotella sp.]
MKKFTIAALTCIAAAAFTSCGNGTPSASLKNDVDTLSYALGMSQSDGIKEYLSERLGIDTAYIDDFLKGVTEGATAGEDKKKAAYMAGLQIGTQFGTQMLKGANYELFGNDSTQTISLKNVIAGFADGVKGKGALMTVDQARKTFEVKMQAIKKASMEKQYGEYKKANEKYLADNAKKPGVVTLPSGVQYKVITEGKGALAADTSMVKVHYEGKTIDGQVFDSSYKRGEPVDMRANQVIPGWKEVLTKMPVGSKWEVSIPADLAYGAEARGQIIKPFSTLVFTIELISIK